MHAHILTDTISRWLRAVYWDCYPMLFIFQGKLSLYLAIAMAAGKPNLMLHVNNEFQNCRQTHPVKQYYVSSIGLRASARDQ